MKNTMPTGLYRNRDSTEWENVLFMQTKSKACSIIVLNRKIGLVQVLCCII